MSSVKFQAIPLPAAPVAVHQPQRTGRLYFASKARIAFQQSPEGLPLTSMRSNPPSTQPASVSYGLGSLSP